MKHFSLVLAAFTVLGFGAATANAGDDARIPLFHGKWAKDGAQCDKTLTDTGVAENQFIEIGRGTFRMWESFCEITQVVQMTDRQWRSELVCSSEGESVTNDWAIDKASSTEFTVIGGAGDGSTYKLCQ